MLKISDIYVPIDFSHAKEIIPPGEDIIYSTAAQGWSRRGNVTTKYSSHLLMTREGFAFTMPKKKEILAGYCPWHKVLVIKGDKFTLNVKEGFKLVNVKAYETYKSFKQRVLEFPVKIAPIFIEKKNAWIKERESQNLHVGPRQRRGVRATIQSYEKFKKKLGLE